MDPKFFERPILNSPYEYPSRHWELDASGQPTNRIRDERRKVAFITPIPKPKKSGAGQPRVVFDEAAQALETEAQQYDLTAFIGGVRQRVDRWRALPDSNSWQVTPETARLLQHWRSHRFGDIRPFFCQVEAVETAIWLTEVAPQRGREERQVLDRLDQASEEANPGIARVALKLATGAGKTMDAIESGIVKLPRVPVADNIPDGEMPKFRNLWEHVRPKMPKRGRGKAGGLDPLSLPVALQTALEALYEHYEKVFESWRNEGIEVPPCFIVVCNNTSTSKLVHDFIAGFSRENEDGSTTLVNGRLALFRNFDEHGNPLARPRTLLIDSEQLDSGEALDKHFRAAAGDEIERFRREIVARTGDRQQAEHLSDQDLLREVMNTVGKPDTLGGSIRCVVSVSMLTEGWDARTVTHVLGVRAFGTQLLCEQVIGRALRRQSYDPNDDGLFEVEYADVLGIPFDFTAEPVPVKPQKPRETVLVKAVTPERDACEIRFPRVEGYRVELPEERLTAKFAEDAALELTPDLVGPSITRNEGIIGEGVDLNLIHIRDLRKSTLLFHLTKRLLETKWRDPGEELKLHLFGQLKRITRQWLDDRLVERAAEPRADYGPQRDFATMILEQLATAGVQQAHKEDRIAFAAVTPWPGEYICAEGRGSRIQVRINGVDVFHPTTGEVRSDGADGIACWFIDTDYNEESFFVRHAYFLGANDPYKALKTTLKAEIDADAWASLHSDLSRPFDRPESGRIAVKVINHLGDEVMKVFRSVT